MAEEVLPQGGIYTHHNLTRGRDRKSAVLSALPGIAGILSAATGTLVILGWMFEIELLKRTMPGFVAMNPMTAVCLILAGGSLTLLQHQNPSGNKSVTGNALAGCVLFVGLVKLGDVAVGFLPNLDELLFASDLSVSGELHPNRMAPNCALSFVLVGISLLTLRRSSRGLSWSQLCAILTGFTALVPLTGYLYGADEFRGLGSFIPMAAHSAFTFLALATGLFFAAATPLTEVFASNQPQGTLVRRLLPLTALMILFLGWIRLWGEQNGFYGPAHGTAFFAIALIMVVVFLVRWTVHTVGELEEERAIVTTRLHEANRRKDEMVAVVSHDLCSPLTAFRTVIDLLREGRREDSEELLELMDNSARRMVTMVRGLLDVAKLDSEQAGLERQDLLVSELVEQSMEPLRINANAKQIKMRLDVEPGEALVSGDPLRISQIFNNLLSNAVKFTAPRGCVSVGVRPTADGVSVAIQDTGLGISAHELPHVFDKYHQTSTKPTGGEIGSGLGLAIVRELVLLHDGRIDVTSELNHGTTFTVYLPANAESKRLVELNVVPNFTLDAVAVAA